MEYIRIETVTNSRERFGFSIESDGLYKINCQAGMLEFSDKISEICMFQNMIVILTQDKAFRNGAQSVLFFDGDRIDNNIIALDSNGKFLWNIGSLVGDIKKPFSNISCIFKEEAEKKFDITLPCDSEVLLHCNAWGDVYLVDPINKKMLYTFRAYYK